VTVDTLLAAIDARPWDDTPRLAYADWLDETAGEVACAHCGGGGRQRWKNPSGQGRRSVVKSGRCTFCCGSGRVPDGRRDRAEFIRVQCELGRLEGADVRRDHSPHRAQLHGLRRRADRLLGGNAYNWLSPIADAPLRMATHKADTVRVIFGGGGCDITFARGFPATLDLPLAALLADPARVGRVVGLTKIVISDAVIHDSLGNDTCFVGNLGIWPSQYWKQLDNHRTHTDARNALSRVALAHCRDAAGRLPAAAVG
jgi:uncharacterized protein (TIGR02996 family)